MSKAADRQIFVPGAVIKASVNKFPVIKHYGIVLSNENDIVSVVHNTPNQRNKYGGNIQVDSLDDFLKSRTIETVIQAKIPRDRIVKVVADNVGRKFHILAWNCETFVWKTWKGYPYSPQIITWTKYFAGISFLGISFVQDKRKKRIFQALVILVVVLVAFNIAKPLKKIPDSQKLVPQKTKSEPSTF